MSKTAVGTIGIIIGMVAGAFIACNVPQIADTLATPTHRAQTTPTQEKLQRLASENMHNFALALHHKDMALFYNNLSAFWKAKTSPAQLTKAFKPFMKAPIDLRVLRNLTPVIDKSSGLQKNGDLRIVGHYNTTPSRVSFKQTYRYDSVEGWRLVEFFVTIK